MKDCYVVVAYYPYQFPDILYVYLTEDEAKRSAEYQRTLEKDGRVVEYFKTTLIDR